MIPRYQRILYWTFLAGILFMGVTLIYGCAHNRSRILAMRDESRIPAPTDLPPEEVSVAQASDLDGSILLSDVSMPLPAEPALRARLILDRMFSDFAQPASTHPLPGGQAVTDVFLLALPLQNPASNSPDNARTSPYGLLHMPDDQLAVVNFSKDFADHHPSGIDTEDLTLRAIIATLHANLPHVVEVRFLVDGQARDSLAGHADLTRPYAVYDPARSIHVLSATGNPM